MRKTTHIKSTRSSRKHAFSSFKERVDSLKIDPNLVLDKRVADYAEESFFLTTLEHWKEVNLSKNFTEFSDAVEGICQTLPQILHHQREIYESLYSHIERNDIYSLQPLLDLLSQFVHDLGPEFLPYYESSIALLMNIASAIVPNDQQNQRNSSNALEWCFNCLAFIFKYLSRNLAEDLVPTIRILSPIFQNSKRAYISKFCAEALSFLIRKASSESIDSLIEYSLLKDSASDNQLYCESMVVLFSEAMKSTVGNFHSKSSMILSKLVSKIRVLAFDNAVYISVLGDIILDVIMHGSKENCGRIYLSLLGEILSLLNVTNLSYQCIFCITRILIVLVFAESGKKISNWETVLSTTKRLLIELEHFELGSSLRDITLQISCLQLCVLIFRNCDAEHFIKFHYDIFKFILSYDGGKLYFAFADAALVLSSPKAINFGFHKQLQNHIVAHKHEELEIQKLSLFISSSESRYEDRKLIAIPESMCQEIAKNLDYNHGENEKELQFLAIYSRLAILRYGEFSGQAEKEFLINLLMLVESGDLSTLFVKDFYCFVIDSLCVLLNVSDDTFISETCKFIIEFFDIFIERAGFISSVDHFIDKFFSRLKNEHIVSLKELVLTTISNLSLSDRRLRYNTIKLLINSNILSESYSIELLSQCRIIEEIPLALSNGRDIQRRIRKLVIDFRNLNVRSNADCCIIANYFFGLLSNGFQPCWDVVIESVDHIADVCSDKIIELAIHFLNFDYYNQTSSYSNIIFLSVEVNGCDNYSFINPNFQENLKKYDTLYFERFSSPMRSLLDLIRDSNSSEHYNEYMRSNVIKLIDKIPQVVEAFSDKFLTLLLRNMDEKDVNEESETSPHKSWSLKDRNEFIKIFGKFKNINKMHRSELLFGYLLRLLSSKVSAVQKIALEVICNWKNKSINNYKDNLINLLDDSTYRDEISKFLIHDSSTIIESADLNDLMPVVIRILFGRAQAAVKSSSKRGRKFAVIATLPNLPEIYIIEFIHLGSDKIPYKQFFETFVSEVPTSKELRRISGFLNLLSEFLSILGGNFQSALNASVEPLLYSLIVSQKLIELEELSDDSDSVLIKAAKSNRQLGTRCLAEIFLHLGANYSWNRYFGIMFDSIFKHRLKAFADENLQQESSMLKIITNWIKFPNLIHLLYFDDYAPVAAVLSLLDRENVKDSVISCVMEFCIAVLKSTSQINQEKFYTVVALVATKLLKNLPRILHQSKTSELNGKAVTLLDLLIKQQYITEDSDRAYLIEACCKVLEKPRNQLSVNELSLSLNSLSLLIECYDCTYEDIKHVYVTCSRSFKFFSERKVREALVLVFKSFGEKFADFRELSQLLVGLNSYAQSNDGDIDFSKRLDSFQVVNEEIYASLNETQWLPLVYCAFYYMNDELELALRSSASYMLARFVDCLCIAKDPEILPRYLHLFRDVILPNLRIGLRSSHEVVQSEYISVLHHIVEKTSGIDEFELMKVLLFNGDEEANFFLNINHIQLHRRQRAIKRVCELRNHLSPRSITFYVLPIIERYALAEDENLRNVSNEAINSMGLLMRCIEWTQYKSALKRYVSLLKNIDNKGFTQRLKLVNSTCEALHQTKKLDTEESRDNTNMTLPSDIELQNFVLREIMPALHKILGIRDDDTIISRMPLSEAMTSLLLCLPDQVIESELPAVLVKICQVMRSRSEELRDVTRKSLSRIVVLLGSKFFKFIIKELRSSLSRGSQIHVLSFTVHALLVAIAPNLKHGDLDETVNLIGDIIMEDIFGSAGQEKDAEGYTSKMKEVKFKKSFDSAEILASDVSLENFGYLIMPIKLLLKEHISLKSRNKLDELLRRYNLGLSKNSESKSDRILILAYQLYKDSANLLLDDKTTSRTDKNMNHFVVELNAKPEKTLKETSSYMFTLQKFSLDLLRQSIGRNEELLSVPKLQGFIPILSEGVDSDNEGIIISCLRVLQTLIKLPFGEKEDAIFKSCARKVLSIIKDAPTTNSELCQASLKFLSSILTHKPEIQLKDTAIAYVLMKIRPDFEELNNQGLAFRFLKAVVSTHIMLPDVYDIMEDISNIMIVNHSREIRDVARSIYLQFLIEYDQGRGRLEKTFKFLIDNLNYPTKTGRHSVLELFHQIIAKAGHGLVSKLSSSLFVALTKVTVTDDSTRCREMATLLISNLIVSIDDTNLQVVESYSYAWLDQNDNALLKRCGLLVYKIMCQNFGMGKSARLDGIVQSVIEQILDNSRKQDDNEDNEAEWEIVYLSLNVFTIICNNLGDQILAKRFEGIWKSLMEALLYPHTWVRALGSRLIAFILSNVDKLEFPLDDFEIQTISYRLLRQLSAPLLTEAMGSQIIRNLSLIAMRWEKNLCLYISKLSEGDSTEKSSKYYYATDFLVSRACTILRLDNGKDSFMTKKFSIQLIAMIIQILDDERVKSVSEEILIVLISFMETNADLKLEEEDDLSGLATECLQILEKKLGKSVYISMYTKAKQAISARRQERKAKRAQMAVSAPHVIAKRKLKKHERLREKRKHVKDANGFYHSKKRKVVK